MLATVDEFRRMVPGAASRMTDEQIEDLIRNIERWCRGVDRRVQERNRKQIHEQVRMELEKRRSEREAVTA